MLKLGHKSDTVRIVSMIKALLYGRLQFTVTGVRFPAGLLVFKRVN